MRGKTCYQRNREVILNGAKGYYENNKELLRGRAKIKYGELSEEEKNIKGEYGKKDIITCLKKRKKRLKKYQENYREAKKIFHKCRCVNKSALQNFYREDIFCSFFYLIFKR